MAKRFITPFAEAGDRAEMPDTPVGSDSNYQTGYPSEYEEDPVANPLTAKFVERDKSNQLYNDITANIKEWQEHGFPEFITSANNGGVPFTYKKNSIVTYLEVDYVSIVDGNEDTPPSNKWVIHSNPINDLSQPYEPWKSVAEMQTDITILPVGKKVFWQGYYTESDGGSNWGIVKSGSHTNDGGSIFTLADGKYVEANLKGKKLSVRKFGAKDDKTFDSGPAIFTASGYSSSLYFPDGEYLALSQPVTVAGASFSWEGESITGTKIIWNGTGAYITLTENPISAKPVIENMTISGFDAATGLTHTGDTLIKTGDKDEAGGNGLRLSNILLTGGLVSNIDYIGSLSGTTENTQITKSAGYGIRFLEDGVAATTSDNTNMTFRNVNILNNNRGVHIEKLIGAVFLTVNIEGSDNEAVIVEPIADDRVGGIIFDDNCWFERNFANYDGSTSDEIAAIDIRNTGKYRFTGPIKISNNRFVNNNDDGALTEARHIHEGPESMVYIGLNDYDRPSSTVAVRTHNEASPISSGVQGGNESLDNEILYSDRTNGIVKMGRFDKYKGDRSITSKEHDIKGIVLNHSEANDNGRTITLNFSDRSNVIHHLATLIGAGASLAKQISLLSEADIWTFDGAWLTLWWDSANDRWQEVASNFYTNSGLNTQFDNAVLDFTDGPFQKAVASGASIRNFTSNGLAAYVGKQVSISYTYVNGNVAPTFDAAHFSLTTDIPLFGGLSVGETRVWVCHVGGDGIAHEISSYKY